VGVSDSKPRLTGKQALFVQEYLVDLNAAKAAVRAGYSARTARAGGYQVLTVPAVAEAIQAEMDKRAEKIGKTAADVLADIERVRRKAEENEEYTVALRASELYGKHLKLFTDQVDHNVNGNVNIDIRFGDG